MTSTPSGTAVHGPTQAGKVMASRSRTRSRRTALTASATAANPKANATRLLALRPAASMEEIAASSGISRATLFRRFPSRAALVSALSERAIEAYIGAVELARPEDGPAPDALRRVLRELSRLAPVYGLLVLQPFDEQVELDLIDRARG